MPWYLPPSKTPPTEEEMERFNVLYEELMGRMAPSGEAEINLAEQVVVAQWFYRQQTFRAKQLRQAIDSFEGRGEPVPLEIAMALHEATRQSFIQKGFAYRRRGKLMRMQAERLQEAAES